MADDQDLLGRRLREARRQRGLTQDQVAAELSMARTTVVAVEKGERRVQPKELIQMATLYGRHIDELVRASEPQEEFAAQFRQSLERAREPGKLQPHISDLERLSEDYVELERLAAAPLTKRYPPVYEIANLPVESVAEEAAVTESNRLGLGDGPRLQLREVLENDVGLRTFALPLPSSVAGFFGFAEAVGGCIAINARHPSDRQRWTLAHEYGHFLSQRRRAEITVLHSLQRVPPTERFADGFARYFLMPTAGIARRFNELKRSRGGKLTPADLLQLAHFYQVSVQALILRLEEMRLVTTGTWDRLDDAGFKVNEARALLNIEPEPSDERLLPLRYQYLAVEVYLKGLITEGQFARFLRLDRVAARAKAAELSQSAEVDEEGRVTQLRMDLGALFDPASVA